MAGWETHRAPIKGAGGISAAPSLRDAPMQAVATPVNARGDAPTQAGHPPRKRSSRPMRPDDRRCQPGIMAGREAAVPGVLVIERVAQPECQMILGPAVQPAREQRGDGQGIADRPAQPQHAVLAGAVQRRQEVVDIA